MANVECVLDAKAALGESAIWDDGDGALYWCDIDGNTVFRFDPSSGTNVATDIGEKAGCIARAERGGLIVGTDTGIYRLDLETGTKALMATPEADRPENRFNDSCTDRQGRWWLGSSGMMKPPRTGESAFYRMDLDGTVMRWKDGITTTNGLAFSPDGRTMYFSDSFGTVRTIWSAPYDPDTGTPGTPSVFFDTKDEPGRPDGGTVDADGCYYMAGVGGWQVLRLTPAGEVDMVIDMPVERPSKPAFGGPNHDTLFVTSISIGTTPGTDQPLAGGLFAITGLPTGGMGSVRYAA